MLEVYLLDVIGNVLDRRFRTASDALLCHMLVDEKGKVLLLFKVKKTSLLGKIFIILNFNINRNIRRHSTLQNKMVLLIHRTIFLTTE